MKESVDSDNSGGLRIAVVGMAGRFPGARDLDEFWRNLRDGKEAVRRFSDEELLATGVDPARLQDPSFVKAGAVLDGIESFDAHFFGFSPREAEILDPQHRLFLECVWEALETAGCDPEKSRGPIGLFGGASLSGYMVNAYAASRHVSPFQILLANDKDYLTTRVSYKLNLQGPSLTVQTACSTSLVAVHLACQSLLSGDCDLAIAGGVAVKIPQGQGYFHFPGEPFSPDGHTRAFSSRGQGTVFGNGVGAVVLKRLDEAVEDGDCIRAVIRGTAVNNDGLLKVGYTAPRAEGQAKVILDALDTAEVEPEEITYVEAHGTGTALGDPIEISALNRVFKARTSRKGFCAIGSVKTNVGHLETAAGVAGLIKTILALEHGQIPPSLHFDEPNPEIDFENSPFFVNTTLRDWPVNGTPRRAGVSSFGIGGTNAHVVLEEAPRPEPSHPSRSAHLLLVSAKTRSALDTATMRLAQHLEERPELGLADVAYTLQVGRRAFGHRRAVVCRDREDAVAALRELRPERVLGAHPEAGPRTVAFLFPGVGSQYAGMGRELYETETVFRREVDRCAELLRAPLGLDLRTLLYPSADKAEAASARLAEIEVTLPALFTVEHALARLCMSWGLQPDAMLGHSLGEYVAACLAETFDLPGALAVVTARGRLMASVPRGAMLSVPLGEAAALPLLAEDVSLASVNGPANFTLAGTLDGIERVRQRLTADGIESRTLAISHACHSAMMDPILDRFATEVARVKLSAPRIPFLSNVTGTWIRASEATDPYYWARHLRQAVRFSAGVEELLREPKRLLLEVGPGNTLSNLARRQPGWKGGRVALSTLRHPREERSDVAFLLETLGRLWLGGGEIDWRGLHSGEERRRVVLPTYPFERQRYWLEARVERFGSPPPPAQAAAEETGRAEEQAALHARPELSGDYVAPQEGIEQGLAALWQDLLGLDRIGRHDNFFELGGDSLLGTRIMSGVLRLWGVELSPGLIFEAPTVAGLATRIEAGLGAGTAAAPRIVPVDRAGTAGLPLSFAQQRLWVFGQLEPESADFNIAMALRLVGRLDQGALRSALTEISRRHEVLRTRFDTVDGEGVQVIEPVAEWPLPVVDLSGLPDHGEALVRRIAAKESRLPFRLSRQPLLRTTLLRLGDGSHCLLCTAHHIVWDLWSAHLFIGELRGLYAAFTAGRPSPLPELPIQYADFAAWQRSWMRGEVLERGLAYWKDHLRGMPRGGLRLPLDRPRPEVPSFRGDACSFLVPNGVAAGLRTLGRQEEATLFMVLFAAFKALLYRTTGDADLVVGTHLANRNRAETEGLIGFFINPLPVRSNLSGSPTFRELLRRVREVALATYAHQDVPFDRVVAALQPERSLSPSPLFDVLFVLQNASANIHEGRPARVGGEELVVEPFPFSTGASRFELALFMTEVEGAVRGRWEYRTELFNRDTITRISRRFETLLAAITGNPDARLDDLEHETPEERMERAMEQLKQKESSLKKFKRIQPKPVDLLEGELVRIGTLEPGLAFPVAFQPNAADVDLSEWASANRGLIEEQLRRHGAVIFRGFDTAKPSDFENLALAVCPDLYGGYGDLPKADTGDVLYRSTPYPADKAILFHNESSHTPRWPMRQFFYCVKAAHTGGETPLVDCRTIYQKLDPAVRARFAEKGLMYVRNFTEGFDVSWQDFFKTDDRAVVEEYCRENSIGVEWRNSNLRMWQLAPAVVHHPETGEPLFFNQIQLHHIACLEDEVRESLLSLFPEEDLPRNVYYGDGSRIEDGLVREICDLYWQTCVAAPWQEGDVIALDNMLIAHARNPFEGERKILVAMGRMFERRELQQV